MDLEYWLLMAVEYPSDDEDFEECVKVANTLINEVPCQDKDMDL